MAWVHERLGQPGGNSPSFFSLQCTALSSRDVGSRANLPNDMLAGFGARKKKCFSWRAKLETHTYSYPRHTSIREENVILGTLKIKDGENYVTANGRRTYVVTGVLRFQVAQKNGYVTLLIATSISAPVSCPWLRVEVNQYPTLATHSDNNRFVQMS